MSSNNSSTPSTSSAPSATSGAVPDIARDSAVGTIVSPLVDTSHSAGFTIAADHPALPGHFPGMPIVPGVVLLDHALSMIAAGLCASLENCRINSVKFLSPLRPDEAAVLHWRRAAGGAIAFEIDSGERRIASGSLRLQEQS